MAVAQIRQMYKNNVTRKLFINKSLLRNSVKAPGIGTSISANANVLRNSATLPHAKSTISCCTAHQVKSPGNKCCEQYLEHIATQTITCRLLAHAYMVMPKLNIVVV